MTVTAKAAATENTNQTKEQEMNKKTANDRLGILADHINNNDWDAALAAADSLVLALTHLAIDKVLTGTKS